MERGKRDKLLCLFTDEKNLDQSINKIQVNYEDVDKIIVIKDELDENNYYCVYNTCSSKRLDYTMLVNRQGTVLYTINGLNSLIKDIYGEEVNPKDCKINWKDYTNCIITCDKGSTRIINTKLVKVIKEII